jgi:hypothetical protein
MFFRQLLASIVALGALGAGTAYACPAGGGDNLPVAIEPELSEAEELLLEARELEDAAATETAKARSAQTTARKQRQLAAALRERARLFPELDVSTLLARAQVADREARSAESRAKTHSGRAKTLRTRAAELRALAKRLAFGEGSRML